MESRDGVTIKGVTCRTYTWILKMIKFLEVLGVLTKLFKGVLEDYFSGSIWSNTT